MLADELSASKFKIIQGRLVHESKYGRNILVSVYNIYKYLQDESLARGPKLLSIYTVEQRGFLVRKYWQTSSFKACQTAFRTEFGERRAPSKFCIQKLVKKSETRGSRSNACRLLSLGPTEGQSVQKYTQHNEKLKDALLQEIQAFHVETLGKVFQNLEKRIQVCLDVKRDQFQHRL